MGAGLCVLGVSAYGYLGLAGRSLPAAGFDALSVVWALVNGVGIGLFVAVEQDVARRTAGAGGRADRHALRRVAVAAALALAALAAIAAAGSRWWAGLLFGGDASLVALSVVAFAGLAVAYLARGLLAGAGQYGRYGWQLGVDGALRIAGAGALALAGVGTTAAYAAVLALAPLAAVLVTTGRPAALRHPEPVEAAGAGGVANGGRGGAGAATGLAVLTLASLLSALLANLGPVAVELLGATASAGGFLAALVVARLPLFLYAAVAAVLLPTLAAAAGSGDLAGFRRQWRRVLAATAALGLAGGLGVAVAGPLAVALLFGGGFEAGLGLLLLLAVGGAAMMVASAGSQAVLALHGDRWAVTGWVAGLAVAVALCLAPLPVTQAVSWALLAGGAVAAAAQLAAVEHLLAHRSPAQGATGRAGAAGTA